MKFLLILLFAICISTVTLAQNNTEANRDTVKKDSAEVFYPVEIQPSFPGGLPALFGYVSKGVKEANVADKGRVFVTFIVQKDGSLSDIKIHKSLSEEADKAAIKIMTESPKWEPGMSQGKPCRVQYTLPITF